MLHVAYKGGGPAVIAPVFGETEHPEVAKDIEDKLRAKLIAAKTPATAAVEAELEEA